MNNFKLQKEESKLVKIEVNDFGDAIFLHPDNANFIESFSQLYKDIFKYADEVQEQGEKLDAEYEGKEDTPEYVLAYAKLNVGFSEKLISMSENVFGENVLKKYFKEEYDNIPDFIPDVDCFIDFIRQITPIISQVYDVKFNERPIDKKKMDAYKPQDFKKKQK